MHLSYKHYLNDPILQLVIGEHYLNKYAHLVIGYTRRYVVLPDAEYFCSFEDTLCGNIDIQSVSGGATWSEVRRQWNIWHWTTLRKRWEWLYLCGIF